MRKHIGKIKGTMNKIKNTEVRRLAIQKENKLPTANWSPNMSERRNRCRPGYISSDIR